MFPRGFTYATRSVLFRLDMEAQGSMVGLLEAGIAMVEQVSTYLEAEGIPSQISAASSCEPGG